MSKDEAFELFAKTYIMLLDPRYSNVKIGEIRKTFSEHNAMKFHDMLWNDEWKPEGYDGKAGESNSPETSGGRWEPRRWEV